MNILVEKKLADMGGNVTIAVYGELRRGLMSIPGLKTGAPPSEHSRGSERRSVARRRRVSCGGELCIDRTSRLVWRARSAAGTAARR